MTLPNHLSLAQKLADLFMLFPQVRAVALGGSLASGAAADPASDIDLYVFTDSLLPLEDRKKLVEQAGGAARADMNLTFWDLGDEWFHAPTGIEVDMMYWDPGWIEEMIDRVLVRHEASLGYTTAFWHTIRGARPLFDRVGWFSTLQARTHAPYPEALRRAIIEKNFPVLRDVIPSYLHQVEKAVRRGDLVSVNHRVAAFLASYFDVLFAFDYVLHPGEKRLLEFAARLCPHLPEDMSAQVNAVLRFAGTGDLQVLDHLNQLVDGLDRLIQSEPG